MKLVILVAAVALSSAQVQPRYNVRIDSGQYYGGDDGQYRPDNSGQYNDEGRYRPDNSGQYVPDNSGQYDPEKYGDRSASSRGIIGNGGRSGQSTAIAATVLNPLANLGGATRASSLGANIAPVSGKGAGAYYVSVQGAAQRLYDPNRNYAIIRQIQNVDPDVYHYLYETENQIFAEEQGRLANKGAADEALRANGYFQYTGPDSNVYRVDYTADENGFLPTGSHLPTPPPIPDAILRSLEVQKAKGEL